MTLPTLLDEHTDATLLANAARCPEPSRQTILDYLRYGVPPGSFVTALLTNDLLEAVRRGDEQNQALIAEYVKFLYNHAPLQAWGSRDAVRQWIDAGLQQRRAFSGAA